MSIQALSFRLAVRKIVLIGDTATAYLAPVHSNDPNDPNNSFSKSSPNASFEFTVTNPDAIDFLSPDLVYDLTMVPQDSGYTVQLVPPTSQPAVVANVAQPAIDGTLPLATSDAPAITVGGDAVVSGPSVTTQTDVVAGTVAPGTLVVAPAETVVPGVVSAADLATATLSGAPAASGTAVVGDTDVVAVAVPAAGDIKPVVATEPSAQA